MCVQGVRGGITQPDRQFSVGDESENRLTNVIVLHSDFCRQCCWKTNLLKEPIILREPEWNMTL